MKYIAFLYKDNPTDEAYNIIIPDVPGAYSCGYSFLEAVDMAKEALELALEDVKEKPKAHDLEYFTKEKLKKFDIPANAIPQAIEYKEEKYKKVTISLRKEALKIIDNYTKQKHISRSAFLEQSALKYATA